MCTGKIISSDVSSNLLIREKMSKFEDFESGKALLCKLIVLFFNHLCFYVLTTLQSMALVFGTW